MMEIDSALDRELPFPLIKSRDREFDCDEDDVDVATFVYSAHEKGDASCYKRIGVPANSLTSIDATDIDGYRYDIDYKISETPFGVVYVAKRIADVDRSAKRRRAVMTCVLLKVSYIEAISHISNRLGSLPDDPLKEIRAWHFLSGPEENRSCILPLLSCYRDVHTPYACVCAVYPHCDSGDLIHAIGYHGLADGSIASVLPEAVIRRYFRQIVEQLQYMHSVGVAHRDISLENCVVDSHLGCKLIDFGACSFVASQPVLRFPGVRGRRYSVAPEIMQLMCIGAQNNCRSAHDVEFPIDVFKTDIWSLGVLLLSLLCGSVIHDVHRLIRCGTLRNALSDKSLIPIHVSDDGVDLLMSILKVDPTERCSLDYILSHRWLSVRADDAQHIS